MPRLSHSFHYPTFQSEPFQASEPLPLLLPVPGRPLPPSPGSFLPTLQDLAPAGIFPKPLHGQEAGAPSGCFLRRLHFSNSPGSPHCIVIVRFPVSHLRRRNGQVWVLFVSDSLAPGTVPGTYFYLSFSFRTPFDLSPFNVSWNVLIGSFGPRAIGLVYEEDRDRKGRDCWGGGEGMVPSSGQVQGRLQLPYWREKGEVRWDWGPR